MEKITNGLLRGYTEELSPSLNVSVKMLSALDFAAKKHVEKFILTKRNVNSFKRISNILQKIWKINKCPPITKKKEKTMTKKKEETVISYKGFNPDFSCRGYQYEVGKEYEEKGEIKACSRGFHACPTPLDVFYYYPPVDDKGGLNRFAQVEQSGNLDKSENDKIASSKIKIKAELSFFELAKCHVEWVKEQLIPSKEEKSTNTGNQSAATNTGDWSAATNTGNQSAATNTGDRSAATNTGNQSAATNTGDWSAATNTGDWSAATNTGNQSAATNTGNQGIACALGIGAKAMAKNGAIVIVDWKRDKEDNWFINRIFAAKVGNRILGVRIKPEVYYWFENGELKYADNL